MSGAGFGNLAITSNNPDLVVSAVGWGQKTGVKRVKLTQGSELMSPKSPLLQTNSHDI